MTTQADLPPDQRVLAILRRCGNRGTNRLEWAGPDVIDGGPPILHLAGRIYELRKEGLKIEKRRGPHRVAQYVLTEDPVQEHLAVDAPAPPQVAPLTTRRFPSSHDPYSDFA